MLHRSSSTSSTPLPRSGTGRARAARWARARARRIGVSATVLSASAAMLVGFAGQEASHAATNGPTAPYETATIADTNYAIPSGALYVANGGSDSDPGTLAAPFASIHKALSVAPAGGTIVVRGGTYRESLGAIKKKVTIQAYPHEQPWVKGSDLATSFTQGSNGWATPFTASMCDNCYPTDVIQSAYPSAGLPEQVFVDGAPLAQVRSTSAMGPGTFYVDRSSHQIFLNDDPTGHTVEVTVEQSAFTISSKAGGTTIRGIGFEHWGPVFVSNKTAPNVAAMSTPANVTFDADTFAWSSGRFLGIYGDNSTVTNSKFLDNGMNGMTANKVGGLDFENNEVAFSNFEHWDITPGPHSQIGGVKVTGVSNTVWRGNDFHDNFSNGLWFDMQSHNQTIVNNTITNNLGHGASVEISANSIVAGNIFAENGRNGLKVAGDNNIEIWNNTSVDNGWSAFSITEDARHDGSNIATEDTTNVRVANNILESGANSTQPVLYNLDGNHPKRVTYTQMISSDDHNDFGRTNPGAMKFEFSAQTTLVKSSGYIDLTAFQTIGRERASTSTDGMDLASIFTDPDHGDYSVQPAVAAQLSTPAILPAAVAAALGVSTTPAHIGAT